MAPYPFVKDVDLECSPRFGIEVAGDIVAELNALPAVKTFIGLLVPSCRTVRVCWDGVCNSFRVVAVDLEGGGDGSGG